MFNRLIHRSVLPILLASAVLLPSAVTASGGGGGGFSGGTSAPRQERQVDQTYEYGKALFLGRAGEAKKIDYCLKVDGKPKKLRGKHLRAWRGGNQTEFANSLYNCKMPDELALRTLRKEEVAYVLYYLNKRHRLGLAAR